MSERQKWKKKGAHTKSGCKTLQHWIIHQTDFQPRSVHSDCFISYSTRNKFSHSLQIPIFISYTLRWNIRIRLKRENQELSAFLPVCLIPRFRLCALFLVSFSLSHSHSLCQITFCVCLHRAHHFTCIHPLPLLLLLLLRTWNNK